MSDNLTPWTRALLEKLQIPQLFKKFRAFYGTIRFITVCTRIQNCPVLFWGRWSSPRLSVLFMVDFHTILRPGPSLFVCLFVCFWRNSPPVGQRRTTTGRTPLDEWSARRRDLYLTTHNTHNIQISMPPVGFEPTIPASERTQTHTLDRAATGIGPGPSISGSHAHVICCSHLAPQFYYLCEGHYKPLTYRICNQLIQLGAVCWCVLGFRTISPSSPVCNKSRHMLTVY